MKKAWLLILVLIASVISGALLPFSSANAATIYDDILKIQNPDTLYIKEYGKSYTTQQSFSTFTVGGWLENTCSLVSDAISNGAPYFIIGNSTPLTSDYGSTDWSLGIIVLAYVGSDTNPSLTFGDSPNGPSVLMPGSGSDWVFASFFKYSGQREHCQSGNYTSYGAWQTFNLAEIRGLNIEYPEGYGGEAPSSPKEIIKPDFSWVVNDKNVQIKHLKKADLLPNGDDYQLGIQFGFCPNGYLSGSNAQCDGDYETASPYMILEKGGTLSHDFDKYGDYILKVEYTYQSCTRYPSYPATPDYCYMDAPEDTSEYDFESTEVRINLGRQQTTSGSTSDLECDVSGFCSPPSPYEDCSSYGVDVGGYFQCVITNFGTWLMISLQTLFIPNYGNMKTQIDSFTSNFQVKLGFLYTGFQMFIQWLNQLLSLEPNCHINIPDLKFFGSPVNYNLCAFEETSPTIYNSLMIPLRLLMAAGFVFIAYRRLIEILKGLGTA